MGEPAASTLGDLLLRRRADVFARGLLALGLGAGTVQTSRIFGCRR